MKIGLVHLIMLNDAVMGAVAELNDTPANLQLTVEKMEVMKAEYFRVIILGVKVVDLSIAWQADRVAGYVNRCHWHVRTIDLEGL